MYHTSSKAVTTLNRLNIGDCAVVSAVNSENSELRNRLLTMGMVADTEVKVTSIAPLGDPISISVRGFKLSLRLSEAESVRVELPAV